MPYNDLLKIMEDHIKAMQLRYHTLLLKAPDSEEFKQIEAILKHKKKAFDYLTNKVNK